MRAFWSGEIAFGPMTVSAKAYTATKNMTPRFAHLHKECGKIARKFGRSGQLNTALLAILIAAAQRDEAAALEALEAMRAALSVGSVGDAIKLAAELVAVGGAVLGEQRAAG